MTASALSSLGDELALIALTIKVADSSNSGWDVAALLLAGLLPLVIFAPAAGVIVDNFETTRTLAVATALQAAFAVGLAFAHAQPVILLLAFLLGTGAAVATPALYTLVPTVVGDAKATAANAYLESARYAGMILGPLLAGTITFKDGSRRALLVDAVTFVVIAISAMALVTRRHPEGSRDEDVRGEARAGLGIIRRDRLLLGVFTVFGAVVLFAAMDNVAEVFFARDTLQADGWGYGFLASAWILGIVIGASAIARRLRNERLVPALLFASVVGGIAVGAAALSSPSHPVVGELQLAALVFALVMFLVGGVANGVQSVSMRSLVVHRVEDRFRGRAFAAYGGIANGMQLVAMAIGGALVVNVGGRTTLIVGAAGCAAAGLVGALWYATLPAAVRAMPPTARDTDEVDVEITVEVPVSGTLVRLPDSSPVDGSNVEI